jgi:hypothetical protein
VEEVNEYFSAQGYNEEELDVLMILGDADKDKHMTFEEFKKGRSDLQKVSQPEPPPPAPEQKPQKQWLVSTLLCLAPWPETISAVFCFSDI